MPRSSDDEEVVDRDEPAGCPERLHDAQGPFALSEERGQDGFNADARQQEREDADEAQEEEKIVQESLHPGFCGPVRLDALLRLPGVGFEPSRDAVYAAFVRDPEQRRVVDSAAGLHEVQTRQVLCRNQDPRPEGEELQGMVGFLEQYVADDERGLPDLQAIAHPEL